MLQNYLKVAWRSLLKNKTVSLINLLGLSFGIAIIVLIALYSRNERSFDRWIVGKENIYRVYRHWGANDENVVWTPSLLAKKLAEDFPEVEVATGLSAGNEGLLAYNNEKMYVEKIAAVDSTFFQVFPISFLQGKREEAFKGPNEIVLSDHLAKRIFGQIDPLGKVVRYNDKTHYTVSGVIDIGDKNTHLVADAYIRFKWYSPNFSGNNRATYVKLKPKTQLAQLEEKMTTSVNEIIKKEYAASQYTPTNDDFPRWQLQALKDIHLQSAAYSWSDSSGGNSRYLTIILLIGGLILAIAVINYVNLATANAMQRSKEVGIRKVSGAFQFQLVAQFMTEAVLLSFCSLLLGVLLAQACLPIFNTITGRELQLLSWGNYQILLFVIGSSFLIGLLAGIYPSLILSSFPATKALKNTLSFSSKGRLRKILVASQFFITIGLLVVTVFVFRQVQFMIQHDLGFKPEQIMVIPFNLKDSHRKIENLEASINNIKGVKKVSTASRMPGQSLPDWGLLIDGQTNAVYPNVLFAGENFKETMGLEVLEGRFLSRDIASDTLDNFVVNEAFIREFKVENPLEAKVKFTSDEKYGQIVGVIKDFHYQGLSSRINPLLINSGHTRWYAAIQLSTEQLQQTIKKITQLWVQIEPTHPFRYSFLEEDFAKQYAEQERFGKTVLYATLLTLCIAIMGIFGLSTFMIQRRTKEIGIRKILGASVASILALLSRDFLKLIIIAFLFAVPFSWYISKQWLADFAYRINLSWWVFAMAGIFALIIAALTVGLQSLKVVKANPVGAIGRE